MRQYILRRALLMIPTVILVTMGVFALVRFLPGDAVQVLFANFSYAKDVNELRARLGLDKPIYMQYLVWVGNMLRGDFGMSFATNMPVLKELGSRLPVTMELSVMAIIINLLVSLPVGILSAIRQDTVVDYLARTFAILMLAVPGFWVGTMLMTLPSVWFNWMPPAGYVPINENPIRNLSTFIWPALILGLTAAGPTMRMTRTQMLEVLRQDYVRTAWAKGLRESAVIYGHALRNALIPVVTIVGLSLPTIIGGSVIMETIFGLPGMGWGVYDAVNRRDYPVVQGVVLIMSMFTVLVNLFVDMTYGWLDPRVRYS